MGNEHNPARPYELLGTDQFTGVAAVQVHGEAEPFLVRELSYPSKALLQQELGRQEANLGIRSPFLLNLLKVSEDCRKSFCSETYKLSLAYQCGSHSLAEEVKRRKLSGQFFEEKQLVAIASSLALGLGYLYSEEVPHGKVCPEAVLLGAAGQVKLMLPDLAALYARGSAILSPEQLAFQLSGLSSLAQSDVFRLGATMLQCSVLQSVEHCYDKQRGKVRQQSLKQLLQLIGRRYGLDWVQLLERCLRSMHLERPSLQQLESALKNIAIRLDMLATEESASELQQSILEHSPLQQEQSAQPQAASRQPPKTISRSSFSNSLRVERQSKLNKDSAAVSKGSKLIPNFSFRALPNSGIMQLLSAQDQNKLNPTHSSHPSAHSLMIPTTVVPPPLITSPISQLVRHSKFPSTATQVVHPYHLLTKNVSQEVSEPFKRPTQLPPGQSISVTHQVKQLIVIPERKPHPHQALQLAKLPDRQLISQKQLTPIAERPFLKVSHQIVQPTSLPARQPVLVTHQANQRISMMPHPLKVAHQTAIQPARLPIALTHQTKSIPIPIRQSIRVSRQLAQPPRQMMSQPITQLVSQPPLQVAQPTRQTAIQKPLVQATIVSLPIVNTHLQTVATTFKQQQQFSKKQVAQPMILPTQPFPKQSQHQTPQQPQQAAQLIRPIKSAAPQQFGQRQEVHIPQSTFAKANNENLPIRPFEKQGQMRKQDHIVPISLISPTAKQRPPLQPFQPNPQGQVGAVSPVIFEERPNMAPVFVTPARPDISGVAILRQREQDRIKQKSLHNMPLQFAKPVENIVIQNQLQSPKTERFSAHFGQQEQFAKTTRQIARQRQNEQSKESKRRHQQLFNSEATFEDEDSMLPDEQDCPNKCPTPSSPAGLACDQNQMAELPEDSQNTYNNYNNGEQIELSRMSELDQPGQYRIEQYEDGSRYQGWKKDSFRQGQGKLYDANGCLYQGTWQLNQLRKGVLFSREGTLLYQGDWSGGRPEGQGTLYNQEVQEEDIPFNYKDFTTLGGKWSRYEGGLWGGSWEGWGRLFLSSGQVFEGQFRENLPEGKGIFEGPRGRVTGLWVGGLFQ